MREPRRRVEDVIGMRLARAVVGSHGDEQLDVRTTRLCCGGLLISAEEVRLISALDVG